MKASRYEEVTIQNVLATSITFYVAGNFSEGCKGIEDIAEKVRKDNQEEIRDASPGVRRSYQIMWNISPSKDGQGHDVELTCRWSGFGPAARDEFNKS